MDFLDYIGNVNFNTCQASRLLGATQPKKTNGSSYVPFLSVEVNSRRLECHVQDLAISQYDKQDLEHWHAILCKISLLRDQIRGKILFQGTAFL